MIREAAQNSNEKSSLKALAKRHKNKLILISAGVGTIGLGFLGFKLLPKLNIKYSKSLGKDLVNIVIPGNAIDNVEDTLNTIAEEKQTPRYRVEFKSFKTGDWYPKTNTDYINSAYSVASCHSYGRATRIIDTITGEILRETGEDASMAACNGYPNGKYW